MFNDFPSPAALRRALKHPGIAEIEGEGLDDGRVFLHAKPGWVFGCGVTSRSVGDVVALKREMSRLKKTG